MNTGLILLAAGNSVRFGKNKLFALVDGKPMLERAIETAAKTKIPFVVVTQAGKAADTAKDLGAEVIINSRPEYGLSYSVHLGTEHFSDKNALIFMVCDQPYLKAETIQHLVSEFYMSPKRIACISSENRRGNPAMFDISFAPALMALEGDTGGREIIRANPDEVLLVNASSNELKDIDRKSDLNNIN